MAKEQTVDRKGLHLQNGSEPLNEQWHKWWVWLEGRDEVLDHVRSVRYALHPTFDEPVRTVTDRVSKFKLEANGWGEFAIGATVQMEDGEEIALERWISFERSMTEAVDKASILRPHVFLSYGGLDRSLVAPLMERLRQQGLEVTSSDTVPFAESVARSIGEALQRADLVAVVTRGELREWAEGK